MPIPISRMVFVVLLSFLVVALAACGGAVPNDELSFRSAAATPDYDLGLDGRTDKPAQVHALPGAGYTVEPLVTVGDEIPLFTGSYGGSETHSERTYGLPGICDGMGIDTVGKGYFVWLNHEIASGSLSKYSDTVSGVINGARVSLLAFDDDFTVIGGRNLIENIYDRTGLIGQVTLNANKTAVTQWGTVISRLCSATLSDIYGGEPLYFAGEEQNNGRAFVIDQEGNARVIDDLIKFAYENIVPISRYNNETVLFALDDRADRFLTLYVGDRSGGDFGLSDGTCYVGKVKVGAGVATNTGALAINGQYDVEWVEVPRTYDFDGAGPGAPQNLYASTAPFDTWALTVAGATQFKRPEDGHENPKQAGEIHFVTTGSGPSSPSYDTWGKYFELDLHQTNPTGLAKLTFVAAGSPTSWMSFDNVAADSKGNFWIQEDPTGGSQNTMLANNRRASIYRTLLGSAAPTRLFEVSQDLAPFTTLGIPGFAANPWETSGIVEIPGVKHSHEVGVMFDTQAHGWTSGDAAGYVEGGQLLIALPDGYRLPGDRGKSKGKGKN